MHVLASTLRPGDTFRPPRSDVALTVVEAEQRECVFAGVAVSLVRVAAFLGGDEAARVECVMGAGDEVELVSRAVDVLGYG